VKKKLLYISLGVLLIVLGLFVYDLVRISGYPVHPVRPKEPIHLRQDEVYRELKEGDTISDWSVLEGTLEYIDHQYDCSDFRFVGLLRILYEFEKKIPAATLARIESSLFNFRYWWDEPGENSMCYWSENHQILFAMAEYLAGQKYPEVAFASSGLTGTQHMEKARKRILDWLEMRWNYGFTEFNSEVYYKEDIGALINLIDFAEDPEIVFKSTIIMDLLFYDVAVQSIGHMFVSATGRAYEGSRKGGPGVTLGGATTYLWGNGADIGSGMVQGLMYSKNYTLPAVLAEIGRDTNTVVIMQGNGLDIHDLPREGFGKTDNRSMMMQWGMEAFTNPTIIRNTMTHVRNHRMFGNWFLKDLRWVDFTFVRWFRLEKVLSQILKSPSDGVAIQKGNTYTYRTKDYALYTAQNYHPGTFGDQQHLAGMNVGNQFSIFHNHPALEKDVKNQSPNYWVGYGHVPHTVQHQNVSMAIYSLPKDKELLERSLLGYTHAYFPTAAFDTTVLSGNRIFGRLGDTYCAILGKNTLQLRDGTSDDLIQDGKQTFWIIEGGSRQEDGSFAAFYDRIMSNALSFDEENLLLRYRSRGKDHQLQYKGQFAVNGAVTPTDYPRFDSPYCAEPEKPSNVTIAFKGKSLYLDFHQMKREIID
jgi:hypothetical protein